MNGLEIPVFSPDEWEDNIDAGCYSYAMDWRDITKFMLLGERIGKKMESWREDDELIQTLKEELDHFGYTVTETTVDAETPGCKKIYLMRAFLFGRYHFFREDKDGWSHKYPGGLPINWDFEGNPLVNPDLIRKDAYYGWCFAIGRKTG